MGNKLCKYVFIDTQIHHRWRHNYRGPGALLELQVSCKKHGIQVISPTIITKEIESHLLEKSEKLTTTIQAGLDSFQWVKEDLKGEILSIESFTSKIAKDYRKGLDLFLRETRNIDLKSSEASMDEVLQAYFAGKWPFKEKKSRKDLPDAIAFYSLKCFCLEKKERIAVITEDAAFQKAFESEPELFSYYGSIADYLSHVSEVVDDSVEKYNQTIQDHLGEIEDLTCAAAEECLVDHNRRGYEVKKHKISKTNLTTCEVANIYADGFSASFNVDVKVEADVSWYERSYHDEYDNGMRHGFIVEDTSVAGIIRIYTSPPGEPGGAVIIDEISIDEIDETIFLKNDAKIDQGDFDD